MDPLFHLTRKDKWFLGGGNGAIWAPPFPRYPDSFGYWDESYLADVRLQHLFTIIALDSRARPIRFHSEIESWRPDRLILIHCSPNVVIRETRCVLENQSWVSELSLETSPEELDLFQWSLQDLRPTGYGTPRASLADCAVTDDTITYRWDTAWPAELEPDRTAIETERIGGKREAMLPPLSVFVELGADRERVSLSVNLAQRHDESPLWETSVLPEKFLDGKLAGDFKLWVGPGEPDGLVHLVQHYKLASGERIQFLASAGLSASAARASFEETRSSRATDISESAWRRYFAGVPQFESSDPWLTSAYWYRWYGLRLNTVDMPDLPICRGSAFQAESASGFQPEIRQDLEGPETLGLEGQATFSPFVTEGIGFFRNFVTYSAQAHLREVSWMHDPRLATGILENLGKCQRTDGSFPGHNYSCRPSRDFYHADFATGIERLGALHGEGATSGDACRVMARYADYFLAKRACHFSKDDATLFLVFDQNETGQEYMSRYTAVASDADQWTEFRVCGVDASTYMLNLFTWLGEPYDDAARHVIRGLIRLAWSSESSFFHDVLRDEARTGAHPATGMYPMGSPAMQELDLAGLASSWLLNADRFFLPKGFPADSFDDPTFSELGEWKGKRLNCPWNGRSWPMVNSHLVDALAAFARSSGRLKEEAGAAFMKAIKLMFHDGDPSRPNSYEHYNPITGMPALYRGYDDYMHSWIVDLIMRHAVGVQPGCDEVDPLPLDVEWIECRDIPHPRGRMHVRSDRGCPTQVSIEEVS
ncbi:MAG TPA: hypothetical protein VHE55_15440 [Fimbriimonadaceae bacterium]|nr:hypothetical protein [Fimbriimonadaceae bacterium]